MADCAAIAMRALSKHKVLAAGDTALVVEFGDCVDRRVNAHVIALAKQLSDAPVDGIIETVPTFRSLMVHYEPLVVSYSALVRCICELLGGLEPNEQVGNLWRLPVCYDANVAPDLEDVARWSGLSPAQVVECHSTQTYHVYMLGFLPGQAYMGELPEELVLPRRKAPRPKIPAGSVAIATRMTCIFPLETPCGWHLIGRSPVQLWTPHASSISLLAPGDKVQLSPVSLREYETLAARSARGSPAIFFDATTNEVAT